MLNYEFVVRGYVNEVMYGKGLHFALFTFQTYYSVMTYLRPGKQVS